MTEETATVFDLSDLDIETVGLVGRPANKREILLFKSAGQTAQEGGNTMPEDINKEAPVVEAETSVVPAVETPDLGPTVEQLTEDISGLKAFMDRFTGLFKSKDEPVIESVAPVVDTSALEKAIEDQKAELAKALEIAAEATLIAKQERDLRIQAEYVTKAEGLAVPGKPADLASLLKKADETDPEFGKALFEAFEAASAAIVQSGMYVEKGATAPAEDLSDFDAAQKKKADELVAADPTLSRGEALGKAYKMVGDEQPDLARQHVEDRRVEVGRG